MTKRKARNLGFLPVAVATLLCLSLGAQAADDAKNQNQGNQQQNQNNNAQNQQDAKQNGPATAQDAKQNSEATAQEAEQPATELKIIELQHRKPREIQQLLALRTQPAVPPALAAAAARLGQRTARYPGTAGLMVSADDASNTLFVRGSQEQLQDVQQVVNALDVPDSDMKIQTIGSMRLIPISQQHGNAVRRVLSELQLKHQTVQWDNGSIVVICQQESDDQNAQAAQAEKVIAKLTASNSKDQSQNQDKNQDQNKPEKQNQNEGQANSNSQK